MKIFGIPISGMLYYVNWVLTNAQFELLAIDTTVVDYSYKKKDKKKKVNGEFDNTPADKQDVTNAAKAWKEKYENPDSGGVSISDVFGGSTKGAHGMRSDGTKMPQ